MIVKSSNVGAIKVGLRLGPQRLGEYVNRFGFGQTLAPDFRGETAGIVWNPDALDASALASVSMGYQVGVTPLQMATAVSSIANGGHLAPAARRPRVHQGRPPHGRAAQGCCATITAETAATLTTIMEQVVERGTAKRRADPRLHNRRQDRHRGKARQRPLPEVRLQRVVRRLHPVAQAGS